MTALKKELEKNVDLDKMKKRVLELSQGMPTLPAGAPAFGS